MQRKVSALCFEYEDIQDLVLIAVLNLYLKKKKKHFKKLGCNKHGGADTSLT